MNNNNRARVNIGVYFPSAIWPAVLTVDRVYICEANMTRSTVRTPRAISRGKYSPIFTSASLLLYLRGAWTDRDTNDIFAHCSLIFYFLDFKFSNFVCLSELHPLIWFFFKNSFRKKKNIQKTTQNALAPSIFIVLAIVLKLGTPLLHTQAQNTLLQNF